MNKFLKILTLAGLTTTLSVTGLSLTNLQLNTKYKLNTQVETKSSDYVGKKTNENSDTVTLTDNAESNIEVSKNTMDENNNPIVDNSENITPTTLGEDLSNLPKTLEETEEDVSITEDNDTINTDNSANIEIEDDSKLEDNNNTVEQENNSSENNNEVSNENNSNSEQLTEQTTTFISEEEYNSIITSYDEIKEEIEELINDSKKLAETCKNSENLLNDEQKLNIENKTEEINTLLMNVKENIKDLSCCLTGDCENLDNEIKAYYFNEILKLNNKINILQSAMQMYSNPMFRFYQNPYSNVYGFSYYYSPNQDEQLKSETDNESLENEETTDNQNTVNKNTFNLPNNLDTYGPTRRNIDTFFNTALFDDAMFNNYGPYGYNMPYNNFGYTGYNMNGYGNFNNSNYLNKNTIKDNQPTNTPLTVESSDSNNDSILPEELEKKRPKFAKNIDTYTGKTFDGNVNSMTGMKITDYLKQKFNKWFNKKDNQDEVNNYVDNFINKHEKGEKNETSSELNIDDKLISREEQKNYCKNN